MYAQVKLTQAIRENSILVPQKAVKFNNKGQANVFVLDSENKISIKEIVIGRSFGRHWLVLDGLKQGDKVVISGLQKIGSGMTVVVVDNEKAPH